MGNSWASVGSGGDKEANNKRSKQRPSPRERWLSVREGAHAVEDTEAILRQLIPGARFRYSGLAYGDDRLPPDPTHDVWLMMDDMDQRVLRVYASPHAYPPVGIVWT